MLTLYSFGPGANSLKPLLTLYEKGLDFKGVRLNPAKFEHHEEWFKKINPNGQVPALLDGDKVITESTVICEYLEDKYPTTPPLRPEDPYLRAQMRVWTKWVDEYFCWCVSTIGWEAAPAGSGRMAPASGWPAPAWPPGRRPTPRRGGLPWRRPPAGAPP